MTTGSATQSPKAAVPGRVALLDGQNEMPTLEVSTAWSTAEIYLYGAHVTRFTRKGEQSLLFMSQCSRFEPGQAIRGGIPVILPWFGMREGLPTHGFARLKTWELKEVICAPDGSVSVRLHLPDCPEASAFVPFSADYTVTVNQSLQLELLINNCSSSDTLPLETCLHTYFEIGDITAISVEGLKGLDYLDKVEDFARKRETDDCIRFSSEVDRVYLNSTGTVDIVDPRYGRRIRIEKEGSASTVVWNPWSAKAQQMPDFGNEEYMRMVCVESGNVSANSLKLSPGKSAKLRVRLSSVALA
jgi:glucose-6-phosphate 1-epimerase